MTAKAKDVWIVLLIAVCTLVAMATVRLAAPITHCPHSQHAKCRLGR